MRARLRGGGQSGRTAHLLRVASLRGGDQPSLVGKRPVSEDSAAATATPGGPPLLSAQAPLKRIALRGGKAAEEPEPEIDETLYSRQLYVLGHDAMRKMQKSSILLIGLGGLGVEIAKDLALAGVKSLTLHDPQETTPSDFAAQFYLGEADLGIGRAAATVEKLAGLNPHVTIDVLETEVNAEVVARYSLVVCTDRIFGECVRINDACRAQGVKFIMAQTRGVFGHIFVDFGADHEVTDTNGENPAQCLLSYVSTEEMGVDSTLEDTCAHNASDKLVTDTNGENPAQCLLSHVSSEEVGVVSTLEDTRHNLEDGDLVQISGVQGMEGLETLPPMKVKVLGPFSFSVGDTRGMGEYKGGGTVLQVKQAARMNFKTLRQSLQDPQFTTSDYGKIDRERQLLLGFQLNGFLRATHEEEDHATIRLALDSFSAQLNGYPRATHEEDHHMILELAQGFNKEGFNKEEGKWSHLPAE
ncbi:hypothetical protein T484DRAFT_1842447 [Baffinella frigidus]|nr:hypothetical protein T484DRAFT_1842447 [Cryptophyta sp. CCMP2293]